jgi:hypothetical protein
MERLRRIPKARRRWPKAGKPYCRGSLSTVDLLALISFYIVNFIYLCYKTSFLNEGATVQNLPLQFVFPAYIISGDSSKHGILTN